MQRDVAQYPFFCICRFEHCSQRRAPQCNYCAWREQHSEYNIESVKPAPTEDTKP
jgi:hypothetical protein